MRRQTPFINVVAWLLFNTCLIQQCASAEEIVAITAGSNRTTTSNLLRGEVQHMKKKPATNEEQNKRKYFLTHTETHTSLPQQQQSQRQGQQESPKQPTQRWRTRRRASQLRNFLQIHGGSDRANSHTRQHSLSSSSSSSYSTTMLKAYRNTHNFYTPRYGRRYGGGGSGRYSDSSSSDSRAYTVDADDDFRKQEEKSEATEEEGHEDCIPASSHSKSRSKRSKGYLYHRGKKSSKESKSKSKNKESKSKSKSKKSKGKGSRYRSYTSSLICDDGDPLGEVEEILCSSNIDEFKSVVIVQFSGDPQFLTSPEQLALEDAFQSVYNELTFVNCDGYFRQVVGVSLFVPGETRRRRLQTTPSSSTSRTNIISSSFSATGTCRNCPVSDSGSFDLFDDAFRRRKRERDLRQLRSVDADDNAKEKQKIRREQDVDVCVCPDQRMERRFLQQLQQSDLEPDAPTEEQFRQAMNAEIDALVNDGVISNIDGISFLEETPVDEEVAVACSSNILEFETYVDVTFSGSPQNLDVMEISILSILFEQVYNELAYENCDGLFRMTEDTTLVPSASDSYFFVGGSCRDCTVTTAGTSSIFQNVPLRRRLDENQVQMSEVASGNENDDDDLRKSQERYLQDSDFGNGDVCMCLRISDNLNDLNPAAPSAIEVREEMNRRLVELIDAGMINNINSITSLAESFLPRDPAEAPEEPDEPPQPDDMNPVEPGETTPETSMPTGNLPPPKTAMPSLDLPPPKTAMPSPDSPPPKTAMPSPDSPPPKTAMPSPDSPPPKTNMPTIPKTGDMMSPPPKDDANSARTTDFRSIAWSPLKGERTLSPSHAATPTATPSTDKPVYNTGYVSSRPTVSLFPTAEATTAENELG